MLHLKGGISITHTGTTGAVLAKMMIAKPDSGFSSTMNFIDPEATLSQKWHGNGLRIKNLNGDSLRQILVARNSGNQVARIRGKIPYTKPNGDMAAVDIPETEIVANGTKIINLRDLIVNANVPASVNYAGIELSYNRPKGTVIVQVFSVSQNGNHVFQVPMFDPEKTPASAGGYPWKADGDYSTLVYIKNETDQPKKFTANVSYEGGSYTLGVKEIKRNQTVAIDFRNLRDLQTPDVNGNIIPLNVNKGQIAWSVSGNENKTLSGRSEQISVANGLSSTYDCRNCCPNSIYDANINPFDVFSEIGQDLSFLGTQRDTNCYGQIFPPRSADLAFYNSTDWGVASITYYGGTASALDIGTTMIQASWEAGIWFDDGSERCEYIPVPVMQESPMEVEPPCAIPTNFRQVGPGTDTGSGTLRFEYIWSSSTGNLSDLAAACTVGEIVTYPGIGNYSPPSPPFNQAFLNPTEIDNPARDGSLFDNHRTSGGFVRPYTTASFTATQYYRYSCPCKNGGAYVNLAGPINIVRSVSRIGQTSSYKFTITKSGSSATIDPLP